VHSDIPDARGDSGIVFNRSVSAGPEEVHGTTWDPQAIPVRSPVAASKQVKAWDWSRVRQQADCVGSEWHVVPTGGQHFNGQAERMIGILKKCLEGALAGKRSTKRELGTIVAEAAQMVNSMPIARSTGDPESGGPITPLHFLLGPASKEVPQVRFNEMPKLTQRLQFVEDAKKQFWNK
jgi:hypothetical protein